MTAGGTSCGRKGDGRMTDHESRHQTIFRYPNLYIRVYNSDAVQLRAGIPLPDERYLMLYGILADMAVVMHLLWIIFLLTGACWGRKFFRVKLVHVAGLGFALVSQVFGWYCPLTHLEVWLRELHGQASYSGSFIAYYAGKMIYIEVTPFVIFILTIALILINAAVYVRASRRRGAGSNFHG